MAILIVCAVRDVKVGAFANPFHVPTRAFAVRSFIDEVNRPDEKNMLNKHPADFQLFQLGTFDEESGRYLQSELPELLISAQDALASV